MLRISGSLSKIFLACGMKQSQEIINNNEDLHDKAGETILYQLLVAASRTPKKRKRSEKKVAFRPPLIAKVLLPPLDPPSRACSTDLSPSRDRVRATRFPPLPVSCVSEAGKKETPPSAYLGTSFPREHSYWSLQLQASSGLLLFDSYSSQNTSQLIR